MPIPWRQLRWIEIERQILCAWYLADPLFTEKTTGALRRESVLDSWKSGQGTAPPGSVADTSHSNRVLSSIESAIRV